MGDLEINVDVANMAIMTELLDQAVMMKANMIAIRDLIGSRVATPQNSHERQIYDLAAASVYSFNQWLISTHQRMDNATGSL